MLTERKLAYIYIKVHFTAENIAKVKKSHFMSHRVNEGNITILNVYAPNSRLSKYTKQKN